MIFFKKLISFAFSLYVPGIGHVIGNRYTRGTAALLLYAVTGPILALLIRRFSVFQGQGAFLILLAVYMLVPLLIAVDAWRTVSPRPDHARGSGWRGFVKKIGLCGVMIVIASLLPERNADSPWRFPLRTYVVSADLKSVKTGESVLANTAAYLSRKPALGDTVVVGMPDDTEIRLVTPCDPDRSGVADAQEMCVENRDGTGQYQLTPALLVGRVEAVYGPPSAWRRVR